MGEWTKYALADVGIVCMYVVKFISLNMCEAR